MNKTQAGRLLTLACYLKTEVPADRFDMRNWAELHEGCDYGVMSLQDAESRHPCNTSACAMGHATDIWPKVFALDFDGTDADIVMVDDGTECCHSDLGEFFGLTYEDIDDLFWGGECTPEDKATEIEEVVSKYGYEYAN